MKVQDVISFIQQNIPFDYYANSFPAKADDCALVRIEEGNPPNPYLIGIKHPGLQVIVRHRKGSEAERLSQEIWRLFHGKTHFKIGETTVKSASCDQSEPIWLDEDKNGREMYSINISLTTVEII